MIRTSTYVISISIQLAAILVLMCSSVFGQVKYDCPTQLSAVVIETGTTDKIVEMLIPVSVSVEDSKLEIAEVKVEIAWNQNAFPVVDFAPKTALHTQYDGPISIEKKSEVNYRAGVELSSNYLEFLTPKISGEVGNKRSEIQRYDKLPPQELLLASGTAQRGTGTYFRFQQSPSNTLEGSRDLIVAFEVPSTWRGGVLQVTFTSTGKQRKFASFQSDFEFARVFMLPTYLQGDDQARQFSRQFVNSEMELRHGWSRYESAARSTNQLERWFSSTSEQRLSAMWMHHLIQSGSDSALDKYESRLPREVARAASQFVAARKNLLALGR